ncbi:MAG: hypothetical protein ACPL5F_12250 [Moorellaceae bacterium]
MSNIYWNIMVNICAQEVILMAKKNKVAPLPKVAKIRITGRLDSLTDLLKLRLFEYSPQSVGELVGAAQKELLPAHSPAKIQKNVNRCLTRNPCFRNEGKGLWCLRLEGLKENDCAHRLLQTQGEALRLSDINRMLRESGKPEIAGEQKLVHDGRFVRLKDGRWGLIHWSYIKPEEETAAGGSTAGESAALPSSPAAQPRVSTLPSAIPVVLEEVGEAGKAGEAEKGGEAGQAGEAGETKDFWEHLFPLKPAETPIPEEKAWEEVAAGAEAAALVISAGKEFNLINGGRGNSGRGKPEESPELAALRQEVEDLRRENKNLLADLEKLHQRKEELRQELTQAEEQLVNLRVERDALKKRVSHLETRLMQLQGTLNKTVNDAQAEQARLKQQLREQEYRLQTTLIANEDLERAVAELQREKQELKKYLTLWPVRLALKLAAFLGLTYSRHRPRLTL